MPTLPKRFTSRFAQQFGEKELSQLTIALSSHLAPSIRLHPKKQFKQHLRAVPWCDLGGYLRADVTFGADPLWHGGAYYVQEASSMILAQYIAQLPLTPKRVLDLCAAPGGKSSLLRSYIPQESLLISNEIDPKRSQILLENLTRYGLEETIVTSASPQQLRSSGLSADLILVDAPCSGEGMFRKEPAAVEGWSQANVELCATRQRAILDQAWEMLEKGGYLIYSTCTYNREENEEQLHYLQGKHPLAIVGLSLPKEWNIREREEGVYSLMPHRVEGEGLTIFAVQKLGSTGNWMEDKRRNKTKEKEPPALLRSIFNSIDLYQHNNQWHYLSSGGQQVLEQLKGIKILAGGVALGGEKGKDFLPAHAWATSSSVSDKVPFPKVELTAKQALEYLSREVLSTNSEKGINLLTYQGIPLGFAKQIGHRVNNLYPKELKIRNSTLTTDNIPDWLKL